MNQILTVDDKDKIYGWACDQFLYSLENFQIDVSVKKPLAKEILEGVEKSTTLQEMISFFNKLTQKYPYFNTPLLKLKNELNIKKEEEVLDKLKSFLNKSKTN